MNNKLFSNKNINLIFWIVIQYSVVKCIRFNIIFRYENLDLHLKQPLRQLKNITPRALVYCSPCIPGIFGPRSAGKNSYLYTLVGRKGWLQGNSVCYTLSGRDVSLEVIFRFKSRTGFSGQSLIFFISSTSSPRRQTTFEVLNNIRCTRITI